jgi:hypothetical protein
MAPKSGLSLVYDWHYQRSSEPHVVTHSMPRKANGTSFVQRRYDVMFRMTYDAQASRFLFRAEL